MAALSQSGQCSARPGSAQPFCNILSLRVLRVRCKKLRFCELDFGHMEVEQKPGFPPSGITLKVPASGAVAGTRRPIARAVLASRIRTTAISCTHVAFSHTAISYLLRRAVAEKHRRAVTVNRNRKHDCRNSPSGALPYYVSTIMHNLGNFCYFFMWQVQSGKATRASATEEECDASRLPYDTETYAHQKAG